MAINGIKPEPPAIITENLGDVEKIKKSDQFQEILQELEEVKSPEPGSDLAKQQLEMIKHMARMQVMNLNQKLVSALSGSSSGGGTGLPMADMSGILQMLQVMQLQNILNNQSQNSAIDPAKVTENRPDGVSGKGKKAGAGYPFNSTNISNSEIDRIINQTALEVDLDPNLVRAVVKTESNFDPEAVSRAGAMGLMQLMPMTARDLGVDNPFNPVENVHGGARYLKQMLERYGGNLNKALAAYNWGPGNLDRNRNSGFMPEETRNYIRIVNRYYKDFAKMDEA